MILKHIHINNFLFVIKIGYLSENYCSLCILITINVTNPAIRIKPPIIEVLIIKGKLIVSCSE